MYVNRTNPNICCFKPGHQTSVNKDAFEKAVDQNMTSAVSTEENDVFEPVYIGNRELTQVDVAIVKDLQNEFGIDLLSGDLSKRAMWSMAGGDLQQSVDKAMDIMHRHVKNFMKSEGIADVPPIELSSTGDGSIVVTSNHPEKAKIESFFNDNSELRNLFVGITSTQSIIASGKESARFQQKYAVDPQAAIEEFAHLFSGKYKYHTSLSIESGEFTLATQGRFDLSA